MSARELRAEARAWRRRARDLSPTWGYAIAPFPDSHGVSARMYARTFLHERDAARDQRDQIAEGRWHPLAPQEFYTYRVLACLFLALECEDEARALGRGAR